MMMMNCFCGMVDRRKAIRLISIDTPRAVFEPAQNLSSGLVEWSCAVVITTTFLKPLWNSKTYDHYENFHEIQSLRNFILKYLPSVRITISTPVLHVDKANANNINKDFTELVKKCNLDYIFTDYIKELHFDEYGLHIEFFNFSFQFFIEFFNRILQFYLRIWFQEFVTSNVFWTPTKKLTSAEVVLIVLPDQNLKRSPRIWVLMNTKMT